MRPFDWQELMLAAIKERRETPFAWGEHDCVLFAFDVAQAVCAIDFAAPLRGKYRSERGAALALKRFAGAGLEEAAEKIAAEHGCPEVSPLTAQRGDLVILDGERGALLGVCVGDRVAQAGVKSGIQYAPLLSARRAWRIP